ncbi:MAG: hypothetical protein ACYSTF_01600 [Planctomycetota bacterium]|jgi:hypothetical protein
MKAIKRALRLRRRGSALSFVLSALVVLLATGTGLLHADVVMMNSADAYGSVVAKSFEQKNSAAFNYDASLRDVSRDDEAVRFTVDRWGEE